MRSSTIALTFGMASLLLGTGCVHFASVTYPAELNPASQPRDIRIHANEKDKQALSIVLVSQTTNHSAVAVLPVESSLTDAQGRQYSLQFIGGTNYAVGQWHWSWFNARASGPPPKTARLTFRSGTYKVAVAYTADGERCVAETEFAIERRSVPFIILWFALLMHPIGPCG